MRILSAFLVAVVISSSVVGAAVADPIVTDAKISLVGHGEITAEPDTAFITSGITSQGVTAREALDANTASMSQLIAVLREVGIAERDIQTSGFSVNPNYVYSNEPDAQGYQKPPKIVGYQVYNGVTVRVRDVATLGAVLDKAVSVGANTINGVSFSVEDPSDLYDQARVKAVDDATSKAKVYASALGVDLGAVLQVTENLGGGATPPRPYAMYKEVAISAAAPAVPVQAGELTFSVDVLIDWSL